MTDSAQQAFPRLDTPFTQEVMGEADPKTRKVRVPGALLGLPWYKLLIELWNRTGGATGGGSISTGMIVDWPATGTLPSGWLECNGLAISRSTFADLFAVIGVTWGSGDGSSTFNLPDLRDRLTVGATAGKAVGATGGAYSVQLTSDQNGPHTHTITDPGHAHTQQVVNSNTAGASGSQGASTANTTSVGTTNSATTGITINSSGLGNPIDITPKWAGVRKIIKT